jgi:Asp-tRNA(Asn)/Glu-tRNA(Gln) amidotransferase A subunit family amidase
LADIIEAARIHYGFIFAAYVQREVDAHPELLTDYAIAFASQGAKTSKADVLAGLEKEAKIFAGLAAVLERYDALICPTLSVQGYAAGDSYLDHGPMVNGSEVPDILETMMTVPFNICSRCPVLNVPSGTAACGVPTGVQIVGRPYDDVSVFEVGAALERIRPWEQLRPDVSYAE